MNDAYRKFLNLPRETLAQGFHTFEQANDYLIDMFADGFIGPLEYPTIEKYKARDGKYYYKIRALA
jgi:hypothetical protein